jgi:hypothetical protein
MLDVRQVATVDAVCPVALLKSRPALRPNLQIFKQRRELSERFHRTHNNKQKQVLMACRALAHSLDKLRQSNSRSSGKRGKRSIKSRTQRFFSIPFIDYA